MNDDRTLHSAPGDDLAAQVVLGHLGWGHDASVTTGALAERLNWPPRLVQQAVLELRLAGQPVCSDGRGLWLSYEDVPATVESLRGRLRVQYRTMRALQQTYRRHRAAAYQQTTLFDRAA